MLDIAAQARVTPYDRVIVSGTVGSKWPALALWEITMYVCIGGYDRVFSAID